MARQAKKSSDANANSKIAELAEFDSDYIAGKTYLVGVDEAGRGALAGEVCAAACAVSAEFYKNEKYLFLVENINDSKRLTPHSRDELFANLDSLRKIGVIDFEAATASVEEIETVNILEATKLAMGRAVASLNERLSLSLRRAGAVDTLFGESPMDLSKAQLVVDGNPLKGFAFSHASIVKGDASSLAIAAASIVAKVTRDRLMDALSNKYPRYGFDVHKGYGTAAHLQNLLLFGPCPIHRKSFLKKLRAEKSTSEQAELW